MPCESGYVTWRLKVVKLCTLFVFVFACHYALVAIDGHIWQPATENVGQDGGLKLRNLKVAAQELMPEANAKTHQFTGVSFLKVWAEMQTEFVSSLRHLLSKNATDMNLGLIRLVRRHLFPPITKAYKMSYNFPEPPQVTVAREYFKQEGVKRGFFVECGGLDGERSSNTYHLEKDGWQGVLVEADSDYFLQSLGKNRRAWKMNAALCPSNTPSIVKFKETPNNGLGVLTTAGGREVPCIPLALLLKALNRTKVDFLSLDVEGLEMKIE